MRGRLAAILALVLLGHAALGVAAPCGHDPDDEASVAAVRADIERTCVCATAATHPAYVSCARTTALAAVAAQTLRPQCLKDVLHCAARSTCGRPGTVACCLTLGNKTTCRRSSSAERCVARGGCPSAFSSCCDACDAGGCATTTSSTSTSTSTVVEASTTTLACAGGGDGCTTTSTTTGTPTTTLCTAVCGNGVCEVGEIDFDHFCFADCRGVAAVDPIFPATIGACLLEPYRQSGDCAALPGLVKIVSDDACYSSLSSAASTEARILANLPASCCDATTTCGGGEIPPLAIGDAIDTNVGQSATILGVVDDCVFDAQIQYRVPLTPCRTCGQRAEVSGFASMLIDHVVDTGPASSKGIYVRVLCSCGDGVCSTNENCQNCSADCGLCPPVCE